MQGIFIEGLDESVQQKMISYGRMSSETALHDLNRYATVLGALQKDMGSRCSEMSNIFQDSKSCSGSRGCSSRTVNVVKTRRITSMTTATLTTNISAVTQINSRSKSMDILATPNTSACSVTFVASAPVFPCVWGSHIVSRVFVLFRVTFVKYSPRH